MLVELARRSRTLWEEFARQFPRLEAAKTSKASMGSSTSSTPSSVPLLKATTITTSCFYLADGSQDFKGLDRLIIFIVSIFNTSHPGFIQKERTENILIDTAKTWIGRFGVAFLAPSGALIAIPTYYWYSTPLFQITLVLNTGLSLSEPLKLYKGYNAI